MAGLIDYNAMAQLMMGQGGGGLLGGVAMKGGPKGMVPPVQIDPNNVDAIQERIRQLEYGLVPNLPGNYRELQMLRKMLKTIK
jgi:hypothetical protein